MDANPPFDHEKATVGPRTTAAMPYRTCLLALIPSILFVNILLKGTMHFEWRKSAVYKAVYEVLRADVVKNVSGARARARALACSAHVLCLQWCISTNTRSYNKIVRLALATCQQDSSERLTVKRGDRCLERAGVCRKRMSPFAPEDARQPDLVRRTWHPSP
eukprot:scaffold12839_cov96-Skeletonema_dohrnii-CCMP3373.AAC.1